MFSTTFRATCACSADLRARGGGVQVCGIASRNCTNCCTDLQELPIPHNSQAPGVPATQTTRWLLSVNTLLEGDVLAAVVRTLLKSSHPCAVIRCSPTVRGMYCTPC